MNCWVSCCIFHFAFHSIHCLRAFPTADSSGGQLVRISLALKTDLRNLNNIKSLSKTTLIFPLIEHITNNYPSLLKTYDGVFSDYINAYEALMVLCELKK